MATVQSVTNQNPIAQGNRSLLSVLGYPQQSIPWGTGTSYPDFTSYAKSQGFYPAPTQPTSANYGPFVQPNYIGVGGFSSNPISNPVSFQSFMANRYGNNAPNQQSQVNPMVGSGGANPALGLGNNFNLGQSILAGIRK